MNLLPAIAAHVAEGLELTLKQARVTVPSRAAVGPVEIGIRPEHVTLTMQGQGLFDGQVSVVEQLGNTSYVYLDTPSGPLIAEADQGVRLTPGENVSLRFDPTRALVFDAGGLAISA